MANYWDYPEAHDRPTEGPSGYLWAPEEERRALRRLTKKRDDEEADRRRREAREAREADEALAEFEEEASDPKTGIDYLRAVMDSLAGAVPFAGEEAERGISDALMRVPSGFASQWKTLDPETGEAEWRLPPQPIPFEAVMYGGMPLEEWQEANEEIMQQPFRPGIVDETLALAGMPGQLAPGTFGVPEFAEEAEARTQALREDVRGDLGLDAPEGFWENALEGAGMMAGQVPLPGGALKALKDKAALAAGPLTRAVGRLPGAVRGAGRAVGSALGTVPEFLFPTVDPRAKNYLGGAGFAGVMGSLLGGPEGEEAARLEALRAEQEKRELFESLSPREQMDLLDKLFESGKLDVELDDAE